MRQFRFSFVGAQSIDIAQGNSGGFIAGAGNFITSLPHF
jgi:hypothetical protein